MNAGPEGGGGREGDSMFRTNLSCSMWECIISCIRRTAMMSARSRMYRMYRSATDCPKYVHTRTEMKMCRECVCVSVSYSCVLLKVLVVVITNGDNQSLLSLSLSCLQAVTSDTQTLTHTHECTYTHSHWAPASLPRCPSVCPSNDRAAVVGRRAGFLLVHTSLRERDHTAAPSGGGSKLAYSRLRPRFLRYSLRGVFIHAAAASCQTLPSSIDWLRSCYYTLPDHYTLYVSQWASAMQ